MQKLDNISTSEENNETNFNNQGTDFSVKMPTAEDFHNKFMP